MSYLDFGIGKNVIFMHGWGGDASAFLYTARLIMDDCRCVLPEFLGFGESDEPKDARSVSEYAEDVVKLMDALNIPSATLVGHSFGGRVAIELAAIKKDRVDGLVLVDSAGLTPKRGPIFKLKLFLHRVLKRLGLKGLKGSKDYRSASEPMKGTLSLAVNYDETPLLKNITCPTAIFWGRNDKKTPPYMAKKLKAGIADSEIFWLEGGHFAYLDDFDKFFAIFKAFLKN